MILIKDIAKHRHNSTFDILIYHQSGVSQCPPDLDRHGDGRPYFKYALLPHKVINNPHNDDACYAKPLSHQQYLATHLGRENSDITGQLMP